MRTRRSEAIHYYSYTKRATVSTGKTKIFDISWDIQCAQSSFYYCWLCDSTFYDLKKFFGFEIPLLRTRALWSALYRRRARDGYNNSVFCNRNPFWGSVPQWGIFLHHPNEVQLSPFKTFFKLHCVHLMSFHTFSINLLHLLTPLTNLAFHLRASYNWIAFTSPTCAVDCFCRTMSFEYIHNVGTANHFATLTSFEIGISWFEQLTILNRRGRVKLRPL